MVKRITASLSPLLLFVLLTVSMTLPTFSAQAGSTVRVTLPAFKVTLNGEVMDPAFSQYPVIVYKDITYFPMTYTDCRFLGLETSWKAQKEGLIIEATGVTAAYRPYIATVRNNRLLTAVIPAYPIQINGQKIDQTKEPYPLLSFRNITYFPITWKFGAEAFGWDYRFDFQNGLVIKSSNPKLKQIRLGNDWTETAEDSAQKPIAITKEHIYYQGTKGQIMQAPLTEPLRVRQVYQLPIWSYGDGTAYVHARLTGNNGDPLLSYHQGGAIMGTDFLISLKADGTTTVLNDGYNYFKAFGDSDVRYYTGPAPSGGNLEVKTSATDWKKAGSPDYLYGWAWRADGESSGGTGSDSVYKSGDQLYLLAFDLTKPGSTTGIYRVSLKTNDTARVVDREVLGFQLDGETFCYQSGGSLYSYDLKESKENLIKSPLTPPNGIQWFTALNGSVYWQDTQTRMLYDQTGKPVQDGAPLLEAQLKGDQNEFLACTFEDQPATKYKSMILDRHGDVVFKTSDRMNLESVMITGNTLYFYNLTTETVCVGSLAGAF
jgi:hypothetical protein